MHGHRMLIMTVALLLIGLTAGGWATAGQWIVGSASIRNPVGQNVYGEFLAVFLVSTKIPVSAEQCAGKSHPQRRIDCINNRHLDFYKRFQQQQARSDYLVAQTVTSTIGNFAFFDVAPGNYFVLVKFPSLIDGYKVAWQAPVTVSPHRINVVTLNDDNLVLPRNRRR